MRTEITFKGDGVVLAYDPQTRIVMSRAVDFITGLMSYPIFKPVRVQDSLLEVLWKLDDVRINAFSLEGVEGLEAGLGDFDNILTVLREEEAEDYLVENRFSTTLYSEEDVFKAAHQAARNLRGDGKDENDMPAIWPDYSFGFPEEKQEPVEPPEDIFDGLDGPAYSKGPTFMLNGEKVSREEFIASLNADNYGVEEEEEPDYPPTEKVIAQMFDELIKLYGGKRR